MSVEVREATAEERERTVSVETLAFAKDPVMRWLYPEPHEYLCHFPRFADAFGGRAFEHETVWIAGDFGGAAMWLPPGVETDGDTVEAVLRQSLDEAALGTAFAVLEQMGRFHIEEPHWYLPMIGVEPAQQGQGLGSALLSHALARCDEDSLPAYLESSNPANVPLYERHGFRVVDTIQVGEAPPVFPMLRSAR
jgi:GNAT superfamily N-acetyltransferase